MAGPGPYTPEPQHWNSAPQNLLLEMLCSEPFNSEKIEVVGEAWTCRGAHVPTAVLQVVILNCSAFANEETRCYLPFGAATLITPSQTSPVPTTPGQLPGF